MALTVRFIPHPKSRLLSLVAPNNLPALVGDDYPTDEVTDGEVTERLRLEKERPSTFAYSLDTIKGSLEDNDFQEASLRAKKALLQTTIELLPLAERQLRATDASKGIYQYNALATQVRELLADLDGERDLSLMVQQILDESLRPLFTMLSQMIIQFSSGLKLGLRATQLEAANRKECGGDNWKACEAVVDAQVRLLATYVQGMYDELTSRIDKQLKGKK